jgi:putative membrane protein
MVTAPSALTPADHERIRAAVAAAEQRTRAHFALVIVTASDRYALFPVAWGALLAHSVTGVLVLLSPGLTIGTGFLIDAGLFIVLTLVLDWWPLRLRIVPGAIKRRHARLLAHREFASHILGDARHRNGVQFFISLGERYVEVIADRDIHHCVAADTWDKLVADFVEAVRARRIADGCVAAVEACGAALAEHYPVADRS